jgi:outer membrane protein OmpA-like peptidoglycan-associated protein
MSNVKGRAGAGRRSGGDGPPRRFRRLAALLATVLAAATWAATGPAYAVSAGTCSVTWVGGATGTWSTAANWSTNVVAGSAGHTTDEVCIPSTATVTLDQGAAGYIVAGLNDDGSAPGSIVSPASAGGALQINGGAGIPASNVGGLSIVGASITIAAGATLNATSFTLGSHPATVGYLLGNGTLKVAGDIALAGGTINGPAVSLTQTGTHLFTSGDGGGFHTYVYNATVQTPNDVTFSGTTLFSTSSLTTTGNIVVASGAQLTQTSSLTASGIVTSGAASLIGPSLMLTGSTSSIGADVSLGALTLPSGTALTIPGGRTLTSASGSSTITGSLSGAGTLAIGGSIMTVASGGVLTPASVTIAGGSLTTNVGSTVTLGGVSLSSGAWNAYGTASVGAGGVALVADVSSVPSLQGTGSVTVAGDVTVAGGQINGAMTLTQTGAHAFSLSDGLQARSYLYGATVSTPNAISDGGHTYFSGATVTTTGNLVLAAGAQLVQTSNVSAAGLTTVSGAAPSIEPTVTLTGTTSSLGGDVSALALQVGSGGRLFVPAGRTVTVPVAHVLSVKSGGTLTGGGTVDGAVQNDGTVSPGADAAGATVGTLTVKSYAQGAGGTLAVQESASGNDKVAVTGATTTSFDGAVAIATLSGYVPPAGNTLTLVPAPSAVGSPLLGSSLSTTDDLVNGHYGHAAASAKDVVVTRAAVAATAPSAPGISAVAGSHSITVTVTAPTSDGGSAVTGYSVVCSPDCGGTHPLAAPGQVVLTGLTDGTAYVVSATATNSVGTGPAATASATPTTPPVSIPPSASVKVSTARLVVTTKGSFSATCSISSGKVKSCAVSVRSARGVVLATGKAVTVAAGAASVKVPLTVTKAGLSAAGTAGGVTALVTATVTPLAGKPLTAKASLVIVKKTTKVSLLGGVLFGSNSAVLSPAGKKALVAIARQVAGSKSLECDGHTASTGNPSGEHVLGLQRATVVCTFIKNEIKALKLKPIGTYVVKSFGATKPVSTKNPALNRRVELIVTN